MEEQIECIVREGDGQIGQVYSRERVAEEAGLEVEKQQWG